MRLCEYKDCRFPVWGTDKITRIGYCKNHQYARTDTDKRSILQKAMDKAKPGTRTIGIQSPTELDAWFLMRDAEATGFCKNCGGKSCKGDEKYYKFSVAHILAKSLFPSVATHEKNSIELCFFGKSCHTNLDNNILSLSDLNCWDEIIEKFLAMYPAIAKKERRRIPEVLRQYINVDI